MMLSSGSRQHYAGPSIEHGGGGDGWWCVVNEQSSSYTKMTFLIVTFPTEMSELMILY